MITATFKFSMRQIMTSFGTLRLAGSLLSYAIPYTTMAAIKGKLNFNTKHLKKGDPLPPFNGKLRVYNMRFCPYAHRTMLALLAKNIDCEVINVDLADKPEWLSSINPFSKVPAIEIAEGKTITESLVTVEYLDQAYPQRPLLPKDPYKQAIDKVIIQATGPIESLYIKKIKFPDTITEDHYNDYYKALKFVEDQLKIRGTKFFDGNEPGFADYMIWPFMERLRIFDNDLKMKIDDKNYPILAQFLKNMLNDPAVSEYLVPVDILNKFQSAFIKGVKPQFNLLAEN